VKRQRTSIGLDVHARSVVGCGLDGDTGEVFQRRLCPDHREVLEWIGSLPAPAVVVYEAGPTGFGLARYLIDAGIECVVAAPSKLQRPSGDRVKTDARDARHLARLLHLGEIVAVAIPTVEQEAARDLVRAREDCRGDLMTARHRLSKLLLRQGIVYYGGRAWTGKHELWLRTQRFDTPGLQQAYDAAFDAMLTTLDRRDRLDREIEALAVDSIFTPVVRRLGCLRGVSTLTAFGLAAEIGDWTRLTGRSIGAYLGLVPNRILLRIEPGPRRGHQDRQRPRPPVAGRSRLASPSPVSARTGSAPPLGCGLSGGPSARPGRQCAPARPVGELRCAQEMPRGRQCGNRPRARRLVLVAGRPRRVGGSHKCPDEHPVVSVSVWE
jgi:transposase